MSKLQYILLGAAALLLGACSGDEPAAPANGEGNVTVTLRAPEAFTRAAGDASQVTLLTYAVYDVTGEDSKLVERDNVGETEGIKFPLDLQLSLITGHKYSLVFWASSKDAPYSIDWESAAMTVDYENTVASSEALDAFYGFQSVTVDGNASLSVMMRRPFAMVGIGASSEPDPEAECSISVTEAGAGLNLLTGAVTGDAVTATFSSSTVPSGETYPVSGYYYIGYAYVLPTGNPATVTYTYDDASKEVDGVTLQPNFRTNIYGSLPNN